MQNLTILKDCQNARQHPNNTRHCFALIKLCCSVKMLFKSQHIVRYKMDVNMPGPFGELFACCDILLEKMSMLDVGAPSLSQNPSHATESNIDG